MTGPPTKGAHVDRLARRFSARGRWEQRLRMRSRMLAWQVTFFAVSGLKRLLDITGAVIVLAVGLPVLLVAGVQAARRGVPLFHGEPTWGRWSVPFRLLRLSPETPIGALAKRLGLAGLPQWINVLKGDLSVVGPRPLSLRDGVSPRDLHHRQHARPGLVSLWWLKRQTNVDFDDEFSLDRDYAEDRGFATDLGILLRLVPATLLGERVREADLREQVDVLGVTVDNLSLQAAIDRVVALMARPDPTMVNYVNAACLNIAARDATYRQALQQSALVFADGIGVKLAGRILRRPIRQNVNGTDLFPRLMERLQQDASSRERPPRVALLGGRPGIPEQVAAWISEHAPDVACVFVRNGYFDADETPEVCAAVAASEPDLLLVAFGVPRQELFLRENLAACGARVGMGVGGLFDFYSGTTPRAPQWLRDIGMEWSYRLYREPGRMWKRYLVGNGTFLARVLGERLGMWSPPVPPTTSSPPTPGESP